MKSRYETIIYFIAATILVTIGIQVYWNYMHYKANKTELINQVQNSLNNGIESYYADLAKSHAINITTTDTVGMDDERLLKIISSFNADSTNIRTQHIDRKIMAQPIEKGAMEEYRLKTKAGDKEFVGVIRLDTMHRINELASKIIFSITNDILDLEKLSSILSSDFSIKNWPIKFGLIMHDKDCSPTSLLPCDSIRSYNAEELPNSSLKAVSKSTYLPRNNELEIRFSNISTILFQKSLLGILLSLVLSVAIIGTLIFLLRIIRSQKQLAEIKNDLISNITHEFKTPITTISTALQAIENFNEDDDKLKTKNYLSISNDQLQKLNLMVEKLLETATLDSELLNLKKEPTDLNNLLRQVSEKHQLLSPNKIIELNMDISLEKIMVDPFHFENAVSNLVDNALKYGGDVITMTLCKLNSGFEITISDNGEGIDKQHQELVFEKFYRVSKGNIHDIKGFGIGLYYCKKIIEKHGGILSLHSTQSSTTFKITMDGQS